jgi:hypothetical protein
MRFLITAAAAPDAPRAEGSPVIDDQLITAYMKYNEALHLAGVLIASEGLNPAVKGARVGVSGGKRVLLDGPFVESKELVGGFYIIDVKSLDEAIGWAMRCPTGFGSDDVLSIHPMTEAQDLPPEMLKLITEASPSWSATWRK